MVCVDKDDQKIRGLQDGIMPIYEPGLDALVAKNVEADRLKFTTDVKAGKGGCCFYCGWPPTPGDGHADLSFVFEAAAEIGHAIDGYTVVVTKSTVPVGTGREIHRIIAKYVFPMNSTLLRT